jgi:CrcB protein
MLARYLWVALGSALGGMARYWMTLAVAALTGPTFPWPTILINILGSFVIGFFAALSMSDTRFGISIDMRLFVMTGICGGFTTFSAFSLQTLDLMRLGRWDQALSNVLLSVVLCLLAVAAGYYAATLMNAGARPPA